MRKKISYFNQSADKAYQSQTMRFTSFNTFYQDGYFTLNPIIPLSLLRHIRLPLVLLLLVNIIIGCGEMYTEEGHTLGVEINKALIAQKLCNTPKECNNILEIYGGHGDRVHFSIYAPNELALEIVFKLLIERGIQVTHGVPISVVVYPKSREQYGNYFFNPKPSITLEITQ